MRVRYFPVAIVKFCIRYERNSEYLPTLAFYLQSRSRDNAGMALFGLSLEADDKRLLTMEYTYSYDKTYRSYVMESVSACDFMRSLGSIFPIDFDVKGVGGDLLIGLAKCQEA